MRVRWSLRASINFADILDYLEARNPAAATRVGRDVLGTVELARQFPRSGRNQTKINFRRLVSQKYRYLIYYRYDQSIDEIFIFSIKHPRRRRKFKNR